MESTFFTSSRLISAIFLGDYKRQNVLFPDTKFGDLITEELDILAFIIATTSEVL